MNNEAQVLQDNLNKVWNERNADARSKVLKEIYTEQANLYHVENLVTGLAAINDSVTATLVNIPPDFAFTQLKPVTINNGIGRLIWGVGPKGKPPVQTGMDIAHFENGKIRSLYVFLD